MFVLRHIQSPVLGLFQGGGPLGTPKLPNCRSRASADATDVVGASLTAEVHVTDIEDHVHGEGSIRHISGAGPVIATLRGGESCLVYKRARAFKFYQ